VKKMSIEQIQILSFNVNFFGKLIQSFLSGYGYPCEYKMIFYVLPIIMYKESRDKLLCANRRSRMETLFQSQTTLPINKNIKISGKTNLAGFLKRFEELNSYTKQALIILSNEKKIELNKRVILKKKEDYHQYTGEVKNWMRASFYLGTIFTNTSNENLTYFLGVE
jgi:hypothetical protein